MSRFRHRNDDLRTTSVGLRSYAERSFGTHLNSVDQISNLDPRFIQLVVRRSARASERKGGDIS